MDRNTYVEWDLPNAVLEPPSIPIAYQIVQALPPGTHRENEYGAVITFL